MANMVHAVWRGRLAVLLALNKREMVTDEEWDAYLATATALLDELGPAGVRAMSISDGGGPTAKQRATGIQRLGGRSTPWVLITSSRLARGIATALSWSISGFKAFAPAELDRAAAYLGLAPAELPSLVAAIRELNRRIAVETVAQLGTGDGF